MKFLIDTHIYLWWLQDSPKLSEKARKQIQDATEVYVSSASIWEATIKMSIGKLSVDIDQLVAEISKSGFQELPITAAHAATVARLPDIHKDPFDRMLIAQAMSEPLRFLTADGLLKPYSELVEIV
ncbi:type II toxin-antitoxin system VapC family toxin [Undibacterium fentianense]|uniref:Type II toxin-antitoxin system VapC family toxin n=1 Tax=Undibacterium fentianense TaxID=2828728 RepID=A0A941E1Z5_9BURK|nr:type II toxin-antitoxin system VapC family toxin [Undibacterium fentianense]MBR7800905.1 type II toxin-antitoxin system VapC family toxin [Undibacterium fentianense]